MSPKKGRPKTENPRTKHLGIMLTEADFQKAEDARAKDKKPERSLSTWAARKFSEMVEKLTKK